MVATKDKKVTLAQKLNELRPLILHLQKAEGEEARHALMKAFVQRQEETPSREIMQKSMALALWITGGKEWAEDVNTEPLYEVDAFYASIGGLVGYYGKVLELLLAEGAAPVEALLPPPLRSIDTVETSLVEEGILAMAHLGEMYPIGGLATRLEYRDSQGRPTPAALLPLCGISLLEGLIRDVAGREALYYRMTGKKITVPLALMTSEENEEAIEQLLEEKQGFGRPRSSFRLFRQPSVPVLTVEGEWVMGEAHTLMSQPGGHGAIWLAALHAHIFSWFQEQGCHHLIIRQINNPLAGLDHALLSFVGLGVRQQKTFGFLCCERDPKAAEGVLVLKAHAGHFYLSNIEYTEVKAYGIEAAENFPANTNLLYVHLPRIVTTLQEHPLTGFLLNMKSVVKDSIYGGRLESMMQGISDCLVSPTPETLPTFLAYQQRKRTISPVKRKFSGTLLETPEGALYDLLTNAHDLLTQCGFRLPSWCTPQHYLVEGAPLFFGYAPHVGPLYTLIQQKLQGGTLIYGSRWQIELAELYSRNLYLSGSLWISGWGRCQLTDVTVRNSARKAFAKEEWQGPHPAKGGVEIYVAEGGIFEAQGVLFEESVQFHVPAGERWSFTSRGQENVLCKRSY